MSVRIRRIPKNDLLMWVDVTKVEDNQQYIILTDYQGLCPWSHAHMQELIETLQRTMAHVTDKELKEYGKWALLKKSPSTFEHIYGRSDPLWIDYEATHLQESIEPPKKAPLPISGYVYVIKGETYYKIGCTTKPKQRLRPMGAQAPFPLQTVLLIPTEDMTHTEKTLHVMFADKHRRGEWYDLTEYDVNQIRREYETIDPTALRAG